MRFRLNKEQIERYEDAKAYEGEFPELHTRKMKEFLDEIARYFNIPSNKLIKITKEYTLELSNI